MRYMGIDFGTKKVGIALSDESGSMAFPETVFPNDTSLLAAVAKLIQDKNVAEVVIGHSLGKDGEPNAVHAKAEAFMLDLTLELGLPVHLEPEQFTTQAAIRLQGRSEQTDASAAALILDGFLTRKK